MQPSNAAAMASEPATEPEFDPPHVTIATTAVGTFMGMKDEILLDHMRTTPIQEAKLNRGGSSLSFRITFADGSRAAFKPLQINPQTVPRKEIAAYRINRMLGLNGVPPASARTLHRDELIGKLPPDLHYYAVRIDAETIFDEEGFTAGEVSYWIPTITDSHLDQPEAMAEWQQWLSVGEVIPAHKIGLMAQLSSLLLLDLITNNSDRFSGGNLMTSLNGRTLYFMDNTFGFQVDPEGHLKCRTAFQRCQKFSRRLVATLRSFDRATLERGLLSEPGVLTPDEIRATVARAQVALRHIDILIQLYGEERVLVFP